MQRRRLKALAPSVGAAPPRIAAAFDGNRDRQRAAQEPWRGWYRSARWLALREEVLRRDLWTCRQTGVLLVAGRTKPNAAVIDHIRPHRGDPALFWDIDNLQAVAKAWHDTVKQSREKRGEA